MKIIVKLTYLKQMVLMHIHVNFYRILPHLKVPICFPCYYEPVDCCPKQLCGCF
jgi:hypothetical protein